MAIHESRHQSDLEKRLRLLRQQMYGKSQSPAISHQPSDKKQMIKPEGPRLASESYSDITYLRADLLKIAIFSAFIFGAQAALYFLLKQNLLNINLF